MGFDYVHQQLFNRRDFTVKTIATTMTIHDLVDFIGYAAAFMSGVVLTVVYVMVKHPQRVYKYESLPRDEDGNIQWPRPGIPAMRNPPPPPPRRTKPLPGSLEADRWTIQQMRNHLIAMKEAYNELSQEQRDNTLLGKKLLEQLRSLNADLKVLDKDFLLCIRRNLNSI